jgi:hypothetical protein
MPSILIHVLLMQLYLENFLPIYLRLVFLHCVPFWFPFAVINYRLRQMKNCLCIFDSVGNKSSIIWMVKLLFWSLFIQHPHSLHECHKLSLSMLFLQLLNQFPDSYLISPWIISKVWLVFSSFVLLASNSNCFS